MSVRCSGPYPILLFLSLPHGSPQEHSVQALNHFAFFLLFFFLLKCVCMWHRHMHGVACCLSFPVEEKGHYDKYNKSIA